MNIYSGFVDLLSNRAEKTVQLAEPRFEPPYLNKLIANQVEATGGELFPAVVHEIALDIIANLNIKTLGRCRQINKGWHSVTDHFLRFKLYEKISNPEDWNEWHKGFQIPLEERKKAFRTLPLNVDLNAYTIAYKPEGLTLKELAGLLNQKGIYQYISTHVIKNYPDEKSCEGSWVVSTRDLLIGSKAEKYNKQKKRVEKLYKISSEIHEVPKLLEMIVLITGEKIKFNHQLFNGDYTRCQESINLGGKNRQIVVAYAGSCLHVHNYRFGFDHIGIAALRKSSF